MEVIVRPKSNDAVALTASLIAEAIREKPNLVLGLATGRTMEKVYALLGGMCRDEGLDFSGVRTFNLDEYIGLPPEDENSYRSYMQRHLFDHVNVMPENTHIPIGTADDVKAECARYEAKMAEVGGIDFQLLGIGNTGHIGFNEPLSALTSRTRDKALTPETMAQNGPLFPEPSMMPHRAITMGVGTILEAKRCVLLATGEAKAGIIAKAVEGPVTSMVSATALQLHPRCTYIVDEAAASDLSQTEYYHWIFRNEPEWAPYR
jgi:glucosamine-6-phosphate deaminase